MIYGLLRRQQLPHQDAEDISQEVLSYVARELPTFEHNGRPGAFRNWLRQVVIYRLKTFWRRQQAVLEKPAEAIETHAVESEAEFVRQWDREHDQFVVGRLLQLIECEFELKTIQAFRKVQINDQPAREVAAELGMSVAAVYVAKSRVLHRLRVAAEDLVDESLLFT